MPVSGIQTSKTKYNCNAKHLSREHCVQHATVQFHTDAAATHGVARDRGGSALIGFGFLSDFGDAMAETPAVLVWTGGYAVSASVRAGDGAYRPGACVCSLRGANTKRRLR